jgi:hypothetical protein
MPATKISKPKISASVHNITMRKSVFKIENEAELFHDNALMFTKHRPFNFTKTL